MKKQPLHTESISQARYLTRTPEFYLQTLQPEIRTSFTLEQSEAIQSMLASAIPQPAPKIVDLRFGVDLILSRFYVVLFVGKDRRKQRRSYLPEAMTRLGNALAAVILLVGLNLLVSLFIVLFAYLVKSGLGIDFFHNGHLADQIQRLN